MTAETSKWTGSPQAAGASPLRSYTGHRQCSTESERTRSDSCSCLGQLHSCWACRHCTSTERREPSRGQEAGQRDTGQGGNLNWPATSLGSPQGFMTNVRADISQPDPAWEGPGDLGGMWDGCEAPSWRSSVGCCFLHFSSVCLIFCFSFSHFEKSLILITVG